MRRSIAVLLLAALLAGCAAPLPREGAAGISREQLLSGTPVFGAEPVPALPEVDILALDRPMREFLERFVDRRAPRLVRLRQLVQAVISPGTFGLNYSDATHTAGETFATRNGNCLSFTNLFVTMARELGLKASFQQVEVPPEWERHGDSFVLNRHINALVELGQGEQKAVDFNIDDFKSSYERERVSDARAAAHYYNNVGVEHMQAGDARGAFLYLRRGLQADESFAPLWINLGVLYLRADAPGHAEASYLEAVGARDADMVAYSNLARLYERRGDAERARAYRELATRHRDRNPYYRYQLARKAYFAHDNEQALRHLDYAIRRKPGEDAFLFLRGVVRRELGDAAGARADMERAEALASEAADGHDYRGRMERRLREQPP